MKTKIQVLFSAHGNAQSEILEGTSPSVKADRGVVNITFPQGDGRILQSTISLNEGRKDVRFVDYTQAVQVIGHL